MGSAIRLVIIWVTIGDTQIALSLIFEFRKFIQWNAFEVVDTSVDGTSLKIKGIGICSSQALL